MLNIVFRERNIRILLSALLLTFSIYTITELVMCIPIIDFPLLFLPNEVKRLLTPIIIRDDVGQSLSSYYEMVARTFREHDTAIVSGMYGCFTFGLVEISMVYVLFSTFALSLYLKSLVSLHQVLRLYSRGKIAVTIFLNSLLITYLFLLPLKIILGYRYRLLFDGIDVFVFTFSPLLFLMMIVSLSLVFFIMTGSPYSPIFTAIIFLLLPAFSNVNRWIYSPIMIMGNPLTYFKNEIPSINDLLTALLISTASVLLYLVLNRWSVRYTWV